MEALRSLLVQFLHNTTTNWLPVFNDLSCAKIGPADVGVLVNLLQRALKLHQRPIVVIDALDECKQLEELLAAVTKLNGGHLQLFCVSRPEVAITEAFSDLTLICLSVMEGPLREDMERDILAELECRRKLKRLRAGQKEEIRRLESRGDMGLVLVRPTWELPFHLRRTPRPAYSAVRAIRDV